MSDKRMKRRREKLWRENPNCRRCGVPTILPVDLMVRYGVAGNQLQKHIPQHVIDQMATIEHRRSRLNPLRGSDRDEATTLYCYKCNQESNNEELRSIPIEELRKLASHIQDYVKDWRRARARDLQFSPEADYTPDAFGD